MIAVDLLMAAAVAGAVGLSSGEGAIRGTVLNASTADAPVAKAEVVLRVHLEGQIVTVAETTADDRGCFCFEHLPVGQRYQYSPGANRDGVHYPGPRVVLTPQRPSAAIEVRVYNAVTLPSPLVARRHEITVRPEPGVLRVTESIVVDNPTLASYVGRSAQEGAEPVTLQLAIPADFDRVTFQQEFFGRRFSVVEGKLVTGIPWPPGSREVAFTYSLPIVRQYRLWQRPLDLPCADVRVCLVGSASGEVSCNLPAGAGQPGGDLLFDCGGKPLPAGHVVRLELGRLPVRLMAYGPWVALTALIGLIGGTGLAAWQRPRSRGPVSARGPKPARREVAGDPPGHHDALATHA